MSLADLTEKDVREGLSRIVQSDDFRNSPRLCDFLNYVVEETLAGRTDTILAKNIAADVYGRSPDLDNLSTNFVRVDAGRLRRMLATYYAGNGALNPVLIEIAKGGYVPQFSAREVTSQDLPETAMPAGLDTATGPFNYVPSFIVGSVLLLAGLAVLGMWFYLSPVKERDTTDAQDDAVRKAVFDAAPEKLLSATLVEQGLSLMFPTFDTERLTAADGLFQKAIDLDPSNSEAHAGLSLSKSMRSFLTPPGPEKKEAWELGKKGFETAVEMAPEKGLVQVSKAFNLFVRRQDDNAIQAAEQARVLAPDDGFVQDFQALVLLFSGNFEQARDASDVTKGALEYGPRSPRRNVLGAALFHLGDYDGSIQAFESSATQGAPVSALATAYLAAAYQAAGYPETARKKVELHKKSWPKANVLAIASLLYSDPTVVSDLQIQLSAAGL